MAGSRVRVPANAKRGEVIEIRAMALHPMENGFRFDTQGTLIPVNIIHTFICRYNGDEVFRATLQPGISANPYLSFTTVAQDSGMFEFVWLDDEGGYETAWAKIEVS